MLTTKNLTKKYKNEPIFNDVTISFQKAQVSVIVGINGSGKTTFLETVLGMRKQNAGIVHIDGLAQDSDGFKKSLFYLPSDFYLPEFMTGQEYLDFVLAQYETAKPKYVLMLLALFKMTAAREKLIETYSFGMKKKIQLIAAVAANTPYMIADELLSGLDFESVLITINLIELIAQKKGVILVTHDQRILDQFKDAVFLMKNQTITLYEGDVKNIKNIIMEDSQLSETFNHFKSSYFSN